MRTTVTLDPDVEALVKQVMRERGVTFKAALNDAVRSGLAPRRRAPFRQRTFAMGFRPDVNYDKSLRLASAIEDEEVVRKLSVGK